MDQHFVLSVPTDQPWIVLYSLVVAVDGGSKHGAINDELFVGEIVDDVVAKSMVFDCIDEVPIGEEDLPRFSLWREEKRSYIL